jgi:hypothetical protein
VTGDPLETLAALRRAELSDQAAQASRARQARRGRAARSRARRRGPVVRRRFAFVLIDLGLHLLARTA